MRRLFWLAMVVVVSTFMWAPVLIAAVDPVSEIDIGFARYANGQPDGFFASVTAKPGVHIQSASLTKPGGGPPIALSLTKSDSSFWTFYQSSATSVTFPDGAYTMTVGTSAGPSVHSATLGGAIPPSAPANLHTTFIGTNTVTLAWDSYSSPGSIQQLTAFAVSTNGPTLGQKTAAAGSSGDDEAKTAVTSATSLSVPNLQPSQACIGAVTAVSLGAGSNDGVMWASKGFASLPVSFTTLAVPGISPWGVLIAVLLLMAMAMLFIRRSARVQRA